MFDSVELYTCLNTLLTLPLDEEIQKFQNCVSELKKTLENEQLVQKNKKEYDVIASSINSYMTRQEILSRIGNFETQACDFRKSQKDIELLIESYKVEIANCFSALHKSIENINSDITNTRFLQ
jgi:hypothetical protein